MSEELVDSKFWPRSEIEKMRDEIVRIAEERLEGEVIIEPDVLDKLLQLAAEKLVEIMIEPLEQPAVMVKQRRWEKEH